MLLLWREALGTCDRRQSFCVWLGYGEISHAALSWVEIWELDSITGSCWYLGSFLCVVSLRCVFFGVLLDWGILNA